MTTGQPPRGMRRLITVRTRIDRDVDDEIRFHLDSRTEELIASGLSPEEARRRASEEFGSVTESRSELAEVDRRRLRRAGRLDFWHTLWTDAAFAVRSLRRQPGLVAIVVLTLALGIGGNAIMFGVVDRLLLRAPAHVVDADRIVRLYERQSSPDAPASVATTYPMLAALRDDVRAFETVAGYFLGTYTLGRGPEATSPDVMLATDNYFDMLGVRPARGRFFGPDENRTADGPRVAVLAWGYWQRQFGGAEDVVGRVVTLDNKSFTIVGIAPDGFNGVDLQKVDLWVPVPALAADNFGDTWRTRPNAYWIRPIAKLRQGVVIPSVEGEATIVAQRTIRDWNAWHDTLTTIVTGPLNAAGAPGERSVEARVSVALVGVTAVVLLIACANVANLLLARTMQRQRDLAMRRALGAAPGRLAVQSLIEALLLCAAGSVAALAIAGRGGELVRAVLLPDVGWQGAPVDGRVIVVALLGGLVTCLFAGMAPGLHAMRTDPSTLLRAGTHAASGSTHRLRDVLVVAQAALSILLMIGAALFVRSLDGVRHIDIGIEADRTWLVSMDLRRAGFDRAQARQLHADALDRVASMPGIERVTAAAGTVPFRFGNALGISRPDQPDGVRIRPGPYVSAIDTAYFATLGASLDAGREFTAEEVRDGASVVIVNRTLARALWPAGDALGACARVAIETDCTTVVGIVEPVAFRDVIGERIPMLYLPRNHPRARSLYVDGMLLRVQRRGGPTVNQVRREIQALSPAMPFVAVLPYSEILAPDMRPWVLGASMFTVFGIVALVIAAIGLYSVLAYLVAQRRHEIGIRMAIGARESRVLLMIVGDGFRLVAMGLAIGAVLTVWLGRWVEPLLYGVSAHDPWTMVLVAGLFLVVGAVACFVPGLRAARVDPALPLRGD